jgi:hypothetical protein
LVGCPDGVAVAICTTSTNASEIEVQQEGLHGLGGIVVFLPTQPTVVNLLHDDEVVGGLSAWHCHNDVLGLVNFPLGEGNC